jgi:lysophospholipase L1-like esterase
MRHFARLVALLLLAVVALAPATPAHPDPTPTPLRIGVVADSTAESCTLPGAGICGYLDQLLTARGVAVTWHPAVVPGASCGGLVAAQASMLAAHSPHLVVILCGTNNATGSAAQRAQLGAEWRTLVEAAHVAGAMVLPALIQYSDPGISAWQGRGWLPESEARANDVLYGQWGYYDPAGWFAGKLDLQVIPGNRDYLAGGTDGIHPNSLGQQVYAVLIYRALRAHYGWPDDVPLPCGLWGARPDPAYQQYVSYIPCAVKAVS